MTDKIKSRDLLIKNYDAENQKRKTRSKLLYQQ